VCVGVAAGCALLSSVDVVCGGVEVVLVEPVLVLVLVDEVNVFAADEELDEVDGGEEEVWTGGPALGFGGGAGVVFALGVGVGLGVCEGSASDCSAPATGRSEHATHLCVACRCVSTYSIAARAGGRGVALLRERPRSSTTTECASSFEIAVAGGGRAQREELHIRRRLNGAGGGEGGFLRTTFPSRRRGREGAVAVSLPPLPALGDCSSGLLACTRLAPSPSATREFAFISPQGEWRLLPFHPAIALLTILLHRDNL
jgi:hypothetical protein